MMANAMEPISANMVRLFMHSMPNNIQGFGHKMLDFSDTFMHCLFI